MYNNTEMKVTDNVENYEPKTLFQKSNGTGKNILEIINEDINAISFLIKQEANALDVWQKEGQVANVLWSAERLTKFLSYYYLVINSKAVYMNTNHTVGSEKLPTTFETVINHYCFYCLQTNKFVPCTECNIIACITCSMIKDGQLFHKKCYKQKFGETHEWLKDQQKTRKKVPIS